MNSCKIQFSPEIHSGSCKEYSMSWKDICHRVRNPVIIKNTEIEPELWSFYIMKGHRGEYGNLRANQDNVDKVIALQIDFDSGRTIKNFINEFSEYGFVLYTSKSHTKHHNKFRVVMPLHTPIDNEVYSCKANKPYLTDLFKHCDKSTFDSWRKQRVPHITPMTSEYVFHINKGIAFDLDRELMFDNYREAKEKYEFGRSTMSMSIDTDIDPFKDTLEEIIEKTKLVSLISMYREQLADLNWEVRGTGSIHDTCRKIYWSLMHNGVDNYEIYSLIMEYCPHKYISEMKQLCFGG